MSNTPYMNLDLPVPTDTAGPEWAEQIVEALETVDAHDHSPGKGTPVPAAGLDIDDNLDIQEHELDAVGAVNLVSQASSLPASNAQTVYAISGDLWYNNSSGTPVQLTQGSSIATPTSGAVPAGAIMPYAGVSSPAGFLFCNGAAVSRVTYADLFAAIGTIFGAGDGSTTFNVPNAQGRVPVGAGTYTDPTLGSTSRTLGAVAGEASHVQSATELFAHVHGGLAHTHFTAGNVSTANVTPISTTTAPARQRSAGDALDYSMSTDGTAPTVGLTSTSSITETGNAGASTPANVMQPYFVTNYIIKT